MHKALYRKWRPQIFEDVIGQDYIITVLKNQVATGKVGHAYLFTGSRGTGKTTCAKIFSKAVNCECNNSGNPCLECSICKSVANGSAIDVVEIDAASHTGVDNIRDIIEESAFLPAVCKYRVYIIDEAHMLSTSAFNALLKIMEEPPAHIIFILATTEVHQVPVTIISRCQRFDFARISDDLIVSQLLKVAQGEGINLDRDAAQTLARLADGGMRDALSLFDQCASFDNNVTRAVVSKVSGQADRSFIVDMAKAALEQNTAEALSLTKTAHSGSLSFSFITSELISFYRDVMIAKSVGTDDKSLFSIGTDFETLSKFAEKMGLAEIMFCLDILSETLNSLSKSSYPSVLFEQCMIKLCSPFLKSDNDAILARLEKLERRLSSVPTDFSPFNPAHKTAPEPAKNTVPSTSEPESEKVPEPAYKPASTVAPQANAPSPEGKVAFALWSNVLDVVSTTNVALLGLLKNSNAYIDGDIIYIDIDDSLFKIIRDSESNRQSLKSAVKSVMGREFKIAKHKENRASAPTSNAMKEIIKIAERNGVEVVK